MRINSRQIRSFVQIAIDAGKREILEIVSATMYLWNNMFNMQCGTRRVVLMQVAILASVVSALSN